MLLVGRVLGTSEACHWERLGYVKWDIRTGAEAGLSPCSYMRWAGTPVHITQALVLSRCYILGIVVSTVAQPCPRD